MLFKCHTTCTNVLFAGQKDFLSNIVHYSNDGSMLGERRRRWTNSKTAFGECLVGVVSSYNQVIATQLNATKM